MRGRWIRALSMDSVTWHSLPTEIKLAIVDNLANDDVRSLSKVDSKTYQACVPALFHTITLSSYSALVRFLHGVPKSYLRHIQNLDISMLPPSSYEPESSLFSQASSVVTLLSHCSRLSKLGLQMTGSMDKHVLSAFQNTPLSSHIEELSISNLSMEEDQPLSERLVVHIAACLPNMHTLKLHRISRSSMHSPDIEFSYPLIPRVVNDDDIPSHPILGSALNLPSLLRLPSLTRLSVKDTHLGDPEWQSVDVACRLDSLELGGHYLEREDENGQAANRILDVVGETVKELSLATALPPLPVPSLPPSPTLSSSFSPFVAPSGPQTAAAHLSPRNLSRLTIGPYVAIDTLSDTLSRLSASPIESVSVECFDSDVADVSKTLEDFLGLRVCSGAGTAAVESNSPVFYASLKELDLVVINENNNNNTFGKESHHEKLRGLAEFCWDLGLVCRVREVAGDSVVHSCVTLCNDIGSRRAKQSKVQEWNGCAFLELDRC